MVGVAMKGFDRNQCQHFFNSYHFSFEAKFWLASHFVEATGVHAGLLVPNATARCACSCRPTAVALSRGRSDGDSRRLSEMG